MYRDSSVSVPKWCLLAFRKPDIFSQPNAAEI